MAVAKYLQRVESLHGFRTLRRAISSEAFPGLRVYLPARMAVREKAWALRLRASMNQARNRTTGYAANLPPGRMPAEGCFGVLDCARGEGWEGGALEVSTNFLVLLLVDGFGPVGFTAFELHLVFGSQDRPQLTVDLQSVWVEPLLRRLGLSEGMSFEVLACAKKMLAAVEPLPDGLDVVVVGDVVSAGGRRFIEDCAYQFQWQCVEEGERLGGWMVQCVDTQLRD